MSLMIIKNHFAGITLLMICKGRGILEIGKIKPDNKIVGSIKPNKDSINAVCCVSETVEINTPKLSAVMMNSRLSSNRSMILPLTGTWKMMYAINRINAALNMDKIINGTNLPMMMITGFKGETYNISIVPSSFSRVMDMDDNIAETNMRIMVITPGTNIDTLLSSGL